MKKFSYVEKIFKYGEKDNFKFITIRVQFKFFWLLSTLAPNALRLRQADEKLVRYRCSIDYIMYK
jgi:hypothetical protein